MDLTTKVGQLFVYVMDGAHAEVGHADRTFLRDYRPGGVIVYDGHVDDRAQIGGTWPTFSRRTPNSDCRDR